MDAKDGFLMSGSSDVNAAYQVTDGEVDAFIAKNWDTFLDDAARLIAIDSSLDADHAAPGAPFGPGVRAALDEILDIAQRMGLKGSDGDGYAGYADLPGSSGQQLGVIGHVDVVPAGEGWTFPPFKLTRTEGALIGRGTADDKIPLLSALYALKYWIDKGVSLHHTVRFIFGCNEESGMAEIPYYLERHAAPDFLFTPDADFPLCYGEKGLFGVLISHEVSEGAIERLEGGSSFNAVPASARAVVRVRPDDLPRADRIVVSEHESGALVEASGVSGHASLPEGTVNAIGVLAQYLVQSGVCAPEERSWLERVASMALTTDGSAFGVASSDPDFGALTSVVGVATHEGSRSTVSVDIRFPTSITGAQLECAFEAWAQEAGAELEFVRNQEPFVVDPHTVPVQALLAAYRETTDKQAQPFTMGGATYAREFPHAVSFGPADDDIAPMPDWVGSMHGANEGVTEEAVKHAIRVYVRAFGNLAQVEQLSI